MKYLINDRKNTGDIQAKLKQLFASTIEQMLEVEIDEHLDYEKNSVVDNNSGNSRNEYGTKTIISDYGTCEIAVPRDRNGEFEPRIMVKRKLAPMKSSKKYSPCTQKGCHNGTLDPFDNLN